MISAICAEVSHQKNSGKQGKCITFCKKLVEGSAPNSGACRPALAENDPPDHFPGAACPLKTSTLCCGCVVNLWYHHGSANAE